MRKTVTALTAAALIGTATIAAPTPASAHAWWVVPAIVVGVVGGVAVGAAVASRPAHAGPYASGAVYVRPTGARCQIVREHGLFGPRDVQYCR